MNSLMWANCGTATSVACQASHTKQTGTNANVAVIQRSQLTFYWITPSPWTGPFFHLPSAFPSDPILPHRHTLHQLSHLIRSHALHDELTAKASPTTVEKLLSKSFLPLKQV